MLLRTFFLVAVLGLSGCVNDDDVSGYNMALDSDKCRGVALTWIHAPSAAGQTNGEKQTAYDGVYRDCMSRKGYVLSANTR